MEKLLFNLKMKIKAEWDIDVDESTLKVIIHGWHFVGWFS